MKEGERKKYERKKIMQSEVIDSELDSKEELRLRNEVEKLKSEGQTNEE